MTDLLDNVSDNSPCNKINDTEIDKTKMCFYNDKYQGSSLLSFGLVTLVTSFSNLLKLNLNLSKCMCTQRRIPGYKTLAKGTNILRTCIFTA